MTPLPLCSRPGMATCSDSPYASLTYTRPPSSQRQRRSPENRPLSRKKLHYQREATGLAQLKTPFCGFPLRVSCALRCIQSTWKVGTVVDTVMGTQMPTASPLGGWPAEGPVLELPCWRAPGQLCRGEQVIPTPLLPPDNPKGLSQGRAPVGSQGALPRLHCSPVFLVPTFPPADPKSTPQ